MTGRRRSTTACHAFSIPPGILESSAMIPLTDLLRPLASAPLHLARGCALAAFVLALPAAAQSGAPAQAPGTPAANAGKPDTASNIGAKMNELQKIDSTPGTGPEAVAGKAVVVHYTGWLYDPAAPDHKGRKFDSSLDRRQPLTFVLGTGRVIKGWDEGVAGMRVGGKRTLVIPPDLGYGARGAGNAIPPNATLVFDVELMEVRP
jgi:FKBP-type peptidyl-prolyl cis-trans isomerase FkpA